jgi:hypothetical protein
MNDAEKKYSRMIRRVVVLSVLLLLFTVPHTLEDFATGEPEKAQIPIVVLSIVVAVLLSLQALGLYWLGQQHRRGLYVHIVMGLFWPLASGIAQLPTILSGVSYRAGFISVFFVGGILIVGVLLLFFSLMSLLAAKSMIAKTKTGADRGIAQDP